MICPNCGHTTDTIDVPKLSHEAEELGKCTQCSETVVAAGTTRNWEHSKLSTVRQGNQREEVLVDEMLKFYEGADHEDRGTFEDIDRAILDENGDVLYFVEIKERTCTLNGYRNTKFPYAKIESAKELSAEYNVPVYIVLKFRDSWARLKVDDDEDYSKGENPFAPNYRPSQEDKERQVPVEYPVEQLEVMDVRSFCDSADDMLTNFNIT